MASCLCFFEFLRSGEVVCPSETSYDPEWHLCLNNVRTDSHQSPFHLEVTLMGSKTDLFRQGCTAFIGAMVMSINLVAVRGKESGPLFIRESGKFLIRATFVDSLRDVLSTAGLVSSDYAGHSFHIGAATTATQNGMQDALIKTLGRWESSAYQRYIRTSPEILCKMSKALLRSS